MLEKGNKNIVSDAFLRIIIWGEGISIKSVTLPQFFLEILFFLSSSRVPATENAIKSQGTYI